MLRLPCSLHKGVEFLICTEVNHASGSYVYTIGLCMHKFNMADRTAGQLKSALRVSNIGANAFEPRTG